MTRRHVVAVLLVLGMLGGGSALAAPAEDSPACSGEAGQAATHNKHCASSGGQPGGKARGDEDGTGGNVGTGTPMVDSDGDGHRDSADNCLATRNPYQRDRDRDGVGDACETEDTDGDLVPDGFDDCRTADNLDQADGDGDGLGDACDPDDDGDGVADGNDNCPGTANPDQRDADGVAGGDACTLDDDGDLAPDAADDRPSEHQTPGERVDAAIAQVEAVVVEALATTNR